MNGKKITRAIISVSDKTGLVEFAEELRKYGTEIYSTGGTLKALLDGNVEAKSIESYTNFPEILDGRVKTLHPKIYGGILARRDIESHVASLTEHDILEFDLVCINLYPFEKVVQSADFSFEDAIENIDIGGPTMIRAAAKNYKDVAVVIDPSQYNLIMERLNENEGALSTEFRFELSIKAFNRTAVYDSVISGYLNKLQGDDLPNDMTIGLKKVQNLRYGENPHQKASFYTPSNQKDLPWKCLHGKELSFNNLLDLDAAMRILVDFKEPLCAIFKHTNPCGVSAAKTQPDSLKEAMAADPVSYFGGIIAFNTRLEAATAEILSKEFVEIIVAPSYEEEAFNILAKKKNVRIVETVNLDTLKINQMDMRTSSFGFLLQENDRRSSTKEDINIVSKVQPDNEQLEELLFAFKLVKSIKSNAVVFAKGKRTLAVGAGQMSRIDSIKIAIEKAKQAGLPLKDSYFASDAFFPFRDVVDQAAAIGVKGIIQPGGSMRDEESTAAADEAGLIMIHTGIRHFKH
ncbi:MAG: bifunctional phosphoribosylaminoimidazolecarboxamide formyltransferase/IMP cyclohydrolase [Leptospirales bacterium]